MSNKGTDDTIHIIFNIDDHYTRHCGVTMSSVIRNNKKRALHFHILGLGVSDQNKEKLRRVAGPGRGLSFYDIDPALVCELPYLGEHTTISAATYIRLFLTDYLPQDINKVLYLDCDMLVLHNLDELWATNLDGYALAAVEDVITYSNHWLGHDNSVGYFNAGMLLINLQYWRANGAKEQFLSFLTENSDKIQHHDQDALNGIFYNRKLLLDIKWNMMVRFLDKRFRDSAPAYAAKCIGRQPYIVHFADRKKPWNTRSYHPYFPHYYFYQLFTPWKFMMPSKKKQRKS